MNTTGSVSICALLCVVAPAALFASTDSPAPELTSFAYLRSHPVTPLPAAVIDRFADKRPSDDEARAYAPRLEPVETRAEPPRAMTRSTVCSAVVSVARANDLPVPFFANLIWQESSFDSKTVSRAGAQGIAQFMPKTAVEFGLMNPFEPIEALHAAGRFLSQLRSQFGNLGLAAAAYNAGPGRVVDWMTRRKQLPGETRDYVLRITGRPADRWTAHDVRRDPAARLMPARAPCVEVAEEVAAQVKALRVTRLMAELVAATAPPPVVAVAPPAPKSNSSRARLALAAKSAVRPATASAGKPAAAPAAKTAARAAAKAAPIKLAAAKPAAGKSAAAKSSTAKSTPAKSPTTKSPTVKSSAVKLAAAKPTAAKSAVAKPPATRLAAAKPAARKAAPPLVLASKAQKPAAKSAAKSAAKPAAKPALAHARVPAKRTRVAAAR